MIQEDEPTSSPKPSNGDAVGFRFGVFELDVAAGEIRKEGRLLRIRNQPFRILTLLVQNPGVVVTREQLHRELWQADEIVDFDQGLNHGIREIRTLLGDNADSPRFVQTLPRRGYRFLAEVRRLSPLAAPAQPESPPAPSPPEPESTVEAPHPLEPLSSPSESGRSPGRPRAALSILGIVAVGLASVAFWFLQLAPGSPGPPLGPAATRLLVLPFAAASASAEDQLVADGLTDEIIARVGRARPGSITVLGRTSSMAFKTTPPDLTDLQSDLRVTHVIEGRVQRTSRGFRALASLIRVADGARMWSLDDADYDDLWRFQQRVSALVARGVDGAVELPRSVERRSPVSVEANISYLRGRALMANRDRTSMTEAVAAFEACLRDEPAYAPAWASLAEARVIMMDQGLIPATETWPRVKAEADRALSLDSDLAEGWNVLAAYHSMAAGNWDEARRALDRSLSLNPNLVVAHHWNAVRLSAMGKHAEAEASIRRAIDLDPLSPALHGARGSSLAALGRNSEALREFQIAADLRPEWAMTHVWMGRALEREGRWPEAMLSFERGAALGDGAARAYLVRALFKSGEAARAREAYARLRSSREGYVSPYHLALAAFSLGDHETALVDLRRTVAERSPLARQIADPEDWKGFESDPRFQRLVALVRRK